MIKVIQNLKDNGVGNTINKIVRKTGEFYVRTNSQFRRKDHCSSYYGVLMKANWGDTTFEASLFGHYGEFFSNFLNNFPTKYYFIDIGANQGLYSLIAAKNDECIKVLAFEPVKKTSRIFQQNVVINGFTNITLENSAISNKAGTATINYTDGHSGLASLDRETSPGDETFEIDIISNKELSRIVDTNMPDSDVPIVVKIDVEGHEMTVLKELINTSFFSRITAIFYEINEGWNNSNEIETLLKNKGFSNSFRVEGSSKTHYDILTSRAPLAEYI